MADSEAAELPTVQLTETKAEECEEIDFVSIFLLT